VRRQVSRADYRADRGASRFPAWSCRSKISQGTVSAGACPIAVAHQNQISIGERIGSQPLFRISAFLAIRAVLALVGL
jgi:hypothetical protein